MARNLRTVRAAGAMMAALLIGLGMAGEAHAAKALSPQEIAAQRQDILNRMLNRDSDEQVATQRWVCALGQVPAIVTESRSDGDFFAPDAADSCVTVLIRTARDGQLPELYGKLASKLGGSAVGSETLPRAIGASVTHDNSPVAIGNGKAAVVTPALAFDAGFTVAYQTQAANKAIPNADRLKATAEACLAQRQDAVTCFSAGYLYGAQSFALRTAAR